MTTEVEVLVKSPDGPMPAFQVRPHGDPLGGVLVIQKAFGVTEHIKQVARRLAQNGWLAIAPAFFHRQGAPVLAYDDLAAVVPIMGELTAAGLTSDLSFAFEHLEREGIERARMGVVGFCMGGSLSFYAATIAEIGAAVTVYGGGIRQGRFGLPPLTELASRLATPWLGLFGDLDQGIPPAEVEELRAATIAAEVATEIVRYADADHGFNCEDRPAVFNPRAATDAWRRTLMWFREHLASDDFGRREQC